MPFLLPRLDIIRRVVLEAADFDASGDEGARLIRSLDLADDGNAQSGQLDYD